MDFFIPSGTEQPSKKEESLSIPVLSVCAASERSTSANIFLIGISK